MRKTAVYIIVSLMILSSCSHKNEAIELSRDFFTSLSDSTYGKPVDFYPDYDSLGIEAKSDVVDIEESDIRKERHHHSSLLQQLHQQRRNIQTGQCYPVHYEK